jgi:N6-L-threonylcarbamoyladenine synthase
LITLGIETSCDETSVALVEDGNRLLSNVISSQVDMHRAFGGVVPELAARAHLARLPLVMDEALTRAGASLGDVGLVAVTRGPGLIGALLVGVGFARGLSMERGLPLVGVSHLDGHVHSAFLEEPSAEAPVLALIVSGGHTELVVMDAEGGYTALGATLDDAAGEAFDKVARMLGLPYPGGPEIDRLAVCDQGEALRAFPLPRIRVDGLGFSFSGLKTAVRYALERVPAERRSDPAFVALAATAFQARAVEHLVDTLARAVEATSPATVVVAGGVAGNSGLRAAVEARVSGSRLVVPALALCTDNAAMIATAGYHLHQRGAGSDLTVDPGLRLVA